MIVDTHHHFWDPARIPQPWMTAEHAVINRSFEPPDLEPLLRACDIAGTVLVQSAANDRDTDYMFELVADVPWVRAVTAWVALDDVERVRLRLRELGTHAKLRGIRHLIHQEADPHWILRREVQDGLSLVAEAGLVLELPAEFPLHLGDVPELARRHPGLTLVIDHLAKPPHGTPAMARWSAELEAAAEHPNVVAKISGIGTVDLEPAVAVAFAAFGAERLMFGSDWPVSLLRREYGEVVGATVDAIRTVAGDDAPAILGDTAIRVYRLER